MSYQIHIGSNLDVLPTLPDNSVDAIVTDPPYGLEFMGNEWDAPWKQSGAGFSKPGLGNRQTEWPSFTSTSKFGSVNPTCGKCGGRLRGSKKCKCEKPEWKPIGKRRNPENEGLSNDVTSSGMANQMRAFQEWYYSIAVQMYRVLKPGGHILSFGGSRTYHRMTCAIEDAGFEVRDQIMWVYGSGFPKSHNISKAMDKHGEAAEQWDGWGTALKPAHEPICVARKPLEGTVVDNVRKWGVGGLNIDGCRVEFISEEDKQESIQKNQHADFGSTMGGNQVYGDYSMLKPQNYAPPGRWPANLIHDGSQEVLELFPGHDEASAARFFYCPKASKSDRDDGASNNHPTVKPTDLMAYLCRLVTPPGGTILDPFTGSGSTGRGAVSQGFNFIGIELSSDYAAIAEARIKAATK